MLLAAFILTLTLSANPSECTAAECCECTHNNHIIGCDSEHLYVKRGYCVSWNNETAELVHYLCPFSHWNHHSNESGTCIVYNLKFPDAYRIPFRECRGAGLEDLVCSAYNRQGFQCKQCKHGYGASLFTDDGYCADCSTHKYLWVLHLLFQLVMVTLMYLAFIPLNIKGTSSPLNLIITYVQLLNVGLRFGSRLRSKAVCYIGQTFTNVIVTITGFLNLNFFRPFIPPVCLSPSVKTVNALLFDYIVAIYPIVLTFLIIYGIELHDRKYRLIVFISHPIEKCCRLIRSSWNPKKVILDTFATFLLLSYTKILFISLKLLLAVSLYNNCNEMVSSTPTLFFDPTIRFFHSEHLPYVVLALTITITFCLIPPLILTLYPTLICKKSLTLLGFSRWHGLTHIMDIFQGWYKDGTEGTKDYRSFSALYFILRAVLTADFIVIVSLKFELRQILLEWTVLGILHIFLGVVFFTVKPY